MRANELRIGNYILDRGNKILTIDRFIGNKIECDIKGMPDKSENGIPIYYHPFTEEINYLKAIPLTEEWLLKFGFKWKNFAFRDGTFTVRFQKEFYVYLSFDGVRPSQVKLEYCHQLQNLYFALTGEELTIKKVNL